MKNISKASNRMAANDFASMSTDKLKKAIDTLQSLKLRRLQSIATGELFSRDSYSIFED